MPPDEDVMTLKTGLAVINARFDALEKRLSRIEALIFGTIGTACVGVLFGLLTHTIHMP